MHLDPPEVTGYVLDGVTTTSGSSLDNFFNVSSYDVAFGEVADAFMALCSDDSSCSARFKKTGLKATVHGLMRKLDKTPKSTCAQLVKTLNFGEDEDPPSFALRYLFGTLLADTNMRPLIPVVAHRLLRCEKKDVDVLTKLFEISNLDVKSDPSETLISDLVTVSEMWEAPSPSAQELKASFEKVSMSAAMAFPHVSLYWAMSKEKSPTCDKLKLGNYKGNGLVYERDEYWNKAAKIPDQASVLLLNGGLDPVKPNKNAEALLEALDGGNKELITCTYATDINIAPDSCGQAIFVSFVQGEGDLTKLNKTCAQDEASMNWTVPVVLQQMLLGTEDAYDGEYDSSLGGSSSGSGSSGEADLALEELLGSGSFEALKSLDGLFGNGSAKPLMEKLKADGLRPN